ncbi:endonuclease/exonuclease/phosphatase family protein [Rhodoligotrophos defluvii]|uniref:endonuclease/exonuclease/phosphatase family protein n=1 Tax=Rhodoligotrophos defluvii TaxID=2561934 RepID=UPI0010C9D03B|nr:endonuclease/exonuclease/phosphatase family protein [Rhodoligotrophos defluvii]
MIALRAEGGPAKIGTLLRKGCHMSLHGLRLGIATFIAAVVAVTAATAAQPAPPAPPPGSLAIRVLTYNVNDLPWPLRADSQKELAYIGKDLARRMAEGTAPDVVFLQEAFTSRSESLIKNAGYPYVAKGPGRRRTYGKRNGASTDKVIRMRSEGTSTNSTHYVNSGLYVLSRYPIMAKNTDVFGNNCSGNDCLANKSVMHVRIALPGPFKPLDMITTHMDSNIRTEASEKERLKAHKGQTDTIAAFIDELVRPRAAIFAGDMNIRRPPERYDYLIQQTGAVDAGRLCFDTKPKCVLGPIASEKQIWSFTNDHQMIIPGNNYTITPVYMTRNYDEKPKGRELSDHLGFEAIYWLTPKK